MAESSMADLVGLRPFRNTHGARPTFLHAALGRLALCVLGPLAADQQHAQIFCQASSLRAEGTLRTGGRPIGKPRLLPSLLSPQTTSLCHARVFSQTTIQPSAWWSPALRLTLATSRMSTLRSTARSPRALSRRRRTATRSKLLCSLSSRSRPWQPKYRCTLP